MFDFNSDFSHAAFFVGIHMLIVRGAVAIGVWLNHLSASWDKKRRRPDLKR